MKPGLFITFEGTEGGGKTTQIGLLAKRLTAMGKKVRQLREPGGTPISEEIRHLVKYSPNNDAMVPEAELLLICAARAQLVREIICPALHGGEIVLCDRFYDSTTAYQGYGRQLKLESVRSIIHFAVGNIIPDLTLLLHVPLEVSERRRSARLKEHAKDRMEEADADFFRRVEAGFLKIAEEEPQRVKIVDAVQDIQSVSASVWQHVASLVS